MNGQKKQSDAFSMSICKWNALVLILIFASIILATLSCDKIPLIAGKTGMVEQQVDTAATPVGAAQQNTDASLGLIGKVIYIQFGLTILLILLAVWMIIRQNKLRSTGIESTSRTLGANGMSEAPLESRLDLLAKQADRFLNNISKKRISLVSRSLRTQVQQLGDILKEAKEISANLPKTVEDKEEARSKDNNILGKRLAAIELKLDSLNKMVGQKSTNMQIPWQQPQTSSVSFKISDIAQEICNVYNNAVKNPRLQEEFAKRYNPIRIGVVNAMKRARDPKLAPEFKAVDFGDYYAVPIENDKRYAVLPVLGIPLRDVNYEAGYMGSVFECPDYDPKLYYTNIQVVRPAFFETDSSKSQWFFKDRGLLNLGQGLSQG